MKLAVSNIAWPPGEEEAAARLLAELGLYRVEIAPTTVWKNPLESTREERMQLLKWWSSRGIEIVAFQALLYGRPDLTLFESTAKRRETLDYLAGMASIAGEFGPLNLVFGSPRNRKKGAMDMETALGIAADFFVELGEAAGRAGVYVCLEANPPEYGADFLVRALEAVELVRRVDSPWIRLHLDTACVRLAGDSLEEAVREGAGLLRHFHASEPHLADIAGDIVDHEAAAGILARSGYTGCISLEMRRLEPFSLEGLRRSLKRFVEAYTSPQPGVKRT